MKGESYEAVTQRVVARGAHGPYAVAESEEIGFITFSLDTTVWQEEDWPEPGTVVVLSNLRKKRAGWRAMSGRYYGPSDEKEAQKPGNQKRGTE